MPTTIRAPVPPKFGEINMPSIGRVVGFPYIFLLTIRPKVSGRDWVNERARLFQLESRDRLMKQWLWRCVYLWRCCLLLSSSSQFPSYYDSEDYDSPRLGYDSLRCRRLIPTSHLASCFCNHQLLNNAKALWSNATKRLDNSIYYR